LKPIDKSAAKDLRNVFVPSEINADKLTQIFGGHKPKQVAF